MTSILAVNDIYLGSDTDCRITLARPENATYDMTTAQVVVIFKRVLGFAESIFEASSSPQTYVTPSGEEVEQALITSSRLIDSFTGEFLISRDLITADLFRLERTKLYYTVWMYIDSRRIVVEDAFTYVNATSTPV